ncbi:MAG: TolC family protein [Candidatus Krumholzibacteriia bacterium]
MFVFVSRRSWRAAVRMAAALVASVAPVAPGAPGALVAPVALVALVALIVPVEAAFADSQAFPPAQDRTGSAVVRWEDVQRALDAHPALRAALSGTDAAAGAVAEARQYPNPEFGVSLGRSEAVAGGEHAAVHELELSVPLLISGERGSRTAAAAADHQAAQHAVAALRREVVRQLGELFWSAVHDEQHLAALEATREQMTALVQVAHRRVDMGEARPLERDRLEIEAARVELHLEQTAAAARARRQTLALWLGLPESGGLQVAGDLAALPALPSLEAVLSATADQPAVLAADAEARAAAARARAARAARFPEIAIGAFHERELDARAYGGRLAVTLPLWNWNGGTIARARAEEVSARHRADLETTAMVARVRQAHARATAAFAGVRTLRDEILPRAASAAAALERMYQVGEVQVIDVLDARRELVAVEAELLESYLAARLAHLELVTLTGEESDVQP